MPYMQAVQQPASPALYVKSASLISPSRMPTVATPDSVKALADRWCCTQQAVYEAIADGTLIAWSVEGEWFRPRCAEYGQAASA